MEPDNFEFKDLNFSSQAVRYRSQNGETLTFRVWNGALFMTINGDRNNRSILNKNIKNDESFIIAKYIVDIMKLDPGKEITLVHNVYNRQEKKRQLDYIFVIRKDEKKVYHIVIKADGQNYDFIIRGPNANSFSYGTGEIPEDEKSTIEMQHLISFLKNIVPNQENLSSRPQKNNFQSGGNKYPNKNTGYNNQGDFGSPNRNLPSDEDIFQQ